MKLSNIFILILGLFIQTALFSQITIIADKTTGCDSLIVSFSYTTTIPSVTSVRWDFGNGVTGNSTTQVVKYENPGSYNVKVVLNETDSIIEPDFIQVGLKPVLGIVYKDTLNPNNYTYVLRTTINNGTPPFDYNYAWTIKGTTLAEDTSFVIYAFDTTGIFPVQVIATDIVGCTNQLNADLSITDHIIVPNVFTPNNDGSNDEFKILSNGVNFLSFTLYTKTGQLVYKTSAKTIVWDGRMNTGEDVPEGIYYYIVKTTDATPQVTVKGFLYIYR